MPRERIMEEVVQKFLLLCVIFNGIKPFESKGNCNCHEDCAALTKIVQKHNRQRARSEPVKIYLQNETDTTTCQGKTKCCVPKKCRKGWTANESSCFQFHWCFHWCTPISVRSKCRKKQGQLAKVSSASQQAFFIRSLRPVKYIILGGTDQGDEGNWRWPDGSLISNGYSSWLKGHPSGGVRRNCMVMRPFKRIWRSTGCRSTFNRYFVDGYICESPPI